jgi:hypothetical protein
MSYTFFPAMKDVKSSSPRSSSKFASKDSLTIFAFLKVSATSLGGVLMDNLSQ